MVSGYPGPDLDPVVAIGSLHVGALKEMAHFDKCVLKDRADGIGSWGHKLPPVWSCRADYRNIVMRRGKPRLTIDKSMRLAVDLPSHNDAIGLEKMAVIEYVAASQLGRARAILLTAGVVVERFSFDLSKYFKVTGKNRSTWWMAGYVGADGYGYDPRCQFGDKCAPVLCGRQTCLLAEAIKRELRRLDLAYPSKAASIIAWIADRLAGRDAGGPLDFTITALFFFLMFVDDTAAMVLNDGLYDESGAMVMIIEPGADASTARQQFRSELYIVAALGVIKFFGHSEAVTKTWLPKRFPLMIFLGVGFDFLRERMLVPEEKRDLYIEDICDLVAEEDLKLESVMVSSDDLNSVVHKLLHASLCIVLGRQHVHHLMRALRAATRLFHHRSTLGKLALRELVWWLAQLRKPDSEGVPMASRRTFPAPSEGTLAPYFDALVHGQPRGRAVRRVR